MFCHLSYYFFFFSCATVGSIWNKTGSVLFRVSGVIYTSFGNFTSLLENSMVRICTKLSLPFSLMTCFWCSSLWFPTRLVGSIWINILYTCTYNINQLFRIFQHQVAQPIYVTPCCVAAFLHASNGSTEVLSPPLGLSLPSLAEITPKGLRVDGIKNANWTLLVCIAFCLFVFQRRENVFLKIPAGQNLDLPVSSTLMCYISLSPPPGWAAY